MKVIFFFSLLFAFCISANTQDMIHLKKSGAIVEVSIESVDNEVIKYKKSNNKKSTVFSIPLNEVSKIVYKSGEERVFDSVNEAPEIKEEAIDLPIDDTAKASETVLEKPVDSETEDLEKVENDIVQSPVEKKEKKKGFKMKLGLGALLGANVSTLRYAFNNEPVDLGNTYRLGMAGGFMLEWEIFRVFSLYSSLYYKGKGDRINGKSYVSDWVFPQDNPIVYSAEGQGGINKSLGYLEWSFMPLFGYTNSSNSLQIQAGGGVYAAIGLTGREKIDMSIDYYINGEFEETEEIQKTNSVLFVREQIVGEKLPDTHYFNMIDYGLIFYIGVKPRPFIGNIQLAWGKANTLSTSIEELFYSGENIKTARNLSITIAAGYIL